MREDLFRDLLLTFDNDVFQLLMVRIHQLDNILLVIYCPLDTRSAEFSAAHTNLDIVWSSLPNPISIDTILGDLNLPQSAVKWVRDDFALKHILMQQVDHVTHGVDTLDLIYQ